MTLTLFDGTKSTNEQTKRGGRKRGKRVKSKMHTYYIVRKVVNVNKIDKYIQIIGSNKSNNKKEDIIDTFFFYREILLVQL